MNRFGYVGGNPLIVIDPLGLCSDTMSEKIKALAGRGDIKGLQTLLESAGLTPAQQQLARKLLTRLNKIKHIFDKKGHNLDEFVKKVGDKSKAFDKLNDAFAKLAKGCQDGVILDSVVRVNGVNITVRGAVVDGVPKLSTAFIPVVP